MAGLLLSAVPAGDNDHQRRRTAGRCAAARRSAANAGSVMFTAAGEGRTQTFYIKQQKQQKQQVARCQCCLSVSLTR